ncbi:hypothetical protein AKO1_008017, partial [Acrasis kona]
MMISASESSRIQHLHDENRRLLAEKTHLEGKLNELQVQSHNHMMTSATLKFEMFMLQSRGNVEIESMKQGPPTKKRKRFEVDKDPEDEDDPRKNEQYTAHIRELERRIQDDKEKYDEQISSHKDQIQSLEQNATTNSSQVEELRQES